MEDIQREFVTYFENFYKAWVGVSIEDQIWGLEEYLTMFDEEKTEGLFHPISHEEILQVFKYFVKYKCLGLDG